MYSKYREENKRIAKNTIYMTIRLIVMVLIGLYTSRVVLEILGVKDYGTYNVVAGFVTMFSMFTNFFVSSCQRFISYALGKGNTMVLKNVFSTIQIITLIVAILLLVIILPLTNLFIEDLLVIPNERWGAARFVFLCSVVTMSISVIAQPYIALITAHERINFFSIMSIVEYVLKLFAILSLKYIDYGWDNLKVYSSMLVIIAIVVRVSYSMYSKYNFEESKFQYIFDKQLFKKILNFSFWTGCGSLGGIIKDQSGNILLNIFYGVTLNAAKGVAQQVQSIFNQIGNNLMTSISPQITKSYAAGDINRSISLTLLLAKVQGYALAAFSIPLILETDYILDLWLKNPPLYASSFVRWTLILCILQAVSNAYGPLYLAVGKLKKLQMITLFINITIIPTIYVVYKLGARPIAVLYCSIFYQLVIMILSYSNLSSYIKFPLFKFYYDVVLKLIIIICITYFASILIIQIKLTPSFGRFIFITLYSMFIFSFLTYLFGINTYERNKIKLMFTRLKNKK